MSEISRRQLLWSGAVLGLSQCSQRAVTPTIPNRVSQQDSGGQQTITDAQPQAQDSGAVTTDSHTPALTDAQTASVTDSATTATGTVTDAGAVAEPVVNPLTQDFPAWYLGNDSEAPDTVLMFRGNAKRRFYGTGPLRTDLVVKWTKPLGSYTSVRGFDQRAITWSGTGWTGQPIRWGNRVYVGSLDRHVYCWRASDGADIWTYEAGKMFKGSLCFYRGRLFTGNVDNHIHCINAETGRRIWAFDTGTDCDSSGVVKDGILYIGGEAGYIRAFDPMANRPVEHWRLFLGTGGDHPGSSGLEASPAIDGDEIFISGSEGYLYCIDRNTHRERWRFRTGGDTDVSPVVTDRFVYTASEPPSSRLFCVDRTTHRAVWEYRNHGGWWATPAVVDNRLYIGGEEHRFYCFDATTGQEIWRVPLPDHVWSSPCVVDGKVVFGCYDHRLYMLDANNGATLWSYLTHGRIVSTPCIVDGHIYVGTATGRFYCFGPP